ncbi:MAG: isocitrate lyase/PEP mutase family protein [Planctomycetota bacterium]|jgi:2-methylisocitrate lyase-like PEP mutase family enzyme
MIPDEQRRKADSFLALHHGAHVLVLPNAWDVCSAKIFELEGFKALGTTSAGISATLGCPDGERMSLRENLEVVRRIVQHVDLPISADIERGYAETVEGVARSAEAAMAAGAVGINLEDSTGDPGRPLLDPGHMQERIAAARESTSVAGCHLVINARTDAYLLSGGGSAADLSAAIERGNAYHEAGADCVFVPDFEDLDESEIELLASEIAAPLNIIAGERTPCIARLQEIGVARVSFGPRAMRAGLAQLRRIARELGRQGTYTIMTAEALTYAEVNEMMAV